MAKKEAAANQQQTYCLTGHLLVTFGATEDLSPEDIASLRAARTSPAVLVGHMVHTQIDKLLLRLEHGG